MLDPSERRALASLPPSMLRWEIGIVHLDDAPEGLDADSDVVVVTEEGTGRVRAAAPLRQGDCLWPLLERAFLEPAPPTVPARPRAIRCEDPSISDRLRDEMGDTPLRIEVVDALPGVLAAAGSLREHLEPQRCHGLDPSAGPWAEALGRLCEIAPWRRMPDCHLFRFEGGGPELERAVAVVIGLAGEQEGVVVYPSFDAFERFTVLAEAGAVDEAAAEVDATCLYLIDEAEVLREDLEAAREDGLLLPGGRVPFAMATRQGAFRGLTPREQRVLLAVVECIAHVCSTHVDYDERPCTEQLSTAAGVITVHSEPPSFVDEPIAEAFDHAVQVRELGWDSGSDPGVVLKLRKRDALALARSVEEADALDVEPLGPLGVRLRLWADGVHLGALCDVPCDPWLAEHFLGADSLTLLVAAGGPRRPDLRPNDEIMRRRLRIRGPLERR